MTTVEFGLLGPLEAWNDQGELSIVGPKRSALLALLLLRHNLPVSADRIIDDLWGTNPPTSVRTQVHSLVSALRRKFCASGTGVRIETRPPGYLLRMDPGRVDLILFERRVAGARGAAAAGQLSTAAAAFREALQLWRGPALDGVDAPFVTAEAARMEEQRSMALEQRIDAELGLGRHGLLVAELASLVAEHPLRESLRTFLMLALYRSGRRAEALEVYRRGRAVLLREQGLDPGRRLRDLERAILDDEPSLELPTHSRSGPAHSGLVVAS
jgi:DNA-binding SARP family transcriptional activator